jgi:hypothetical protein
LLGALAAEGVEGMEAADEGVGVAAGVTGVAATSNLFLRR